MKIQAAVMCLSFVISSSAFASPIVISDFQDGTTQGWIWSGASTSVIADSGPSGTGDYSLLAPVNPSVYKLNPQNSASEFTGDYSTLGVANITFDAMNPATNDDDLELYAVLYSGDPLGTVPFPERWASLEAAVIPNDGVWRTYSISLLETDMLSVLGSNNYATQFSNVGMISLRHQLAANQSGGSALSSANNSVFLDNIALTPVPVPAAVWLFGSGLLGLVSVARRKKA